MGVSVESGSWFESSGSKTGDLICAKCKTFRCASGAANGEAPPFMFRPVKDEDPTAVSAPDFFMHSLLTAEHQLYVSLVVLVYSVKYA